MAVPIQDLSESLQLDELTHEFSSPIRVPFLQMQSPQLAPEQSPSNWGEHDDFITGVSISIMMVFGKCGVVQRKMESQPPNLRTHSKAAQPNSK
jgi:hypothetical protein